MAVAESASADLSLLLGTAFLLFYSPSLSRGSISSTSSDNINIILVGSEGIGPSTLGLKGPCSTTELRTHMRPLQTCVFSAHGDPADPAQCTSLVHFGSPAPRSPKIHQFFRDLLKPF